MKTVPILFCLVVLQATTSVSLTAGADSLSPAAPDSVLLFATAAMGETSSGTAPESVNTTRLYIVTGTIVGTMVAIQIYQANGWWKDNRRSFHFREDLRYGLSVDKLGHFYGAAVITFVTSKAYRWAGLSDRASLWWGAGSALAFQTYLEVQDGFSEWGFDRVDFASNVAGSFWPVAQHYSPFLRNFDVKFSYRPSTLLDSGVAVGFRGQQHLVFDDYEGQTLWLGVKVSGLLPEGARDVWPPFLGLAVGYGARGVATSHPYSAVFIGLDLDMTKIIPQDTWFLKTLGEALNFIRMPLPAVQIAPSTIWYGVYF